MLEEQLKNRGERVIREKVDGGCNHCMEYLYRKSEPEITGGNNNEDDAGIDFSNAILVTQLVGAKESARSSFHHGNSP